MVYNQASVRPLTRLTRDYFLSILGAALDPYKHMTVRILGLFPCCIMCVCVQVRE